MTPYLPLLLFVGVFLAAWSLTWRFLRYAQSRQLLDVPNARSSHVVATPRGGGVAIGVTTLTALVMMGALGPLAWPTLWGPLGGGALVTLIGFADDRGHVAPRWRLLGHFAAAAWVVACMGGLPRLEILGLVVQPEWLSNGLAVFYLVWMINLTNFMDGIDGIASVETITVSLGGVLLYLLAVPESTSWLAPLVLASATLGFLVWNWPPAKIFMGDTGSGFLGLILAAFSLQAAWVAPRLFWGWVILLGVFIVDATLTLFRRIARAERFYEAHRNHAYQHAAQRWGTHFHVTIAVGAINLCWLLPVALLVVQGSLDGLLGVLIAYAPVVTTALWLRAGTPSPLGRSRAGSHKVVLMKSLTSPETRDMFLDHASRWLLEHRRPFIVSFHLVLVGLSAYCAIWLRFDGSIPAQYWETWLYAMPLLLLIRGITFGLLGLYQGLWRYAGIWDLRRIVVAVVTSSIAFYVVAHWGLLWTGYPRSVIVIDSALVIILMGGVRLIRRLVNDLGSAESRRKVIIYGAGYAGEMLVRDMKTNPQLRYRAIGFIDDDPAKVGQRIHGVPVLGTRDDLPRIMVQRKPDEVLLAIPGSNPTALRSIVRALDSYNVPIKTVPTLNDILENRVEISRIRNLSVQDLLSRGRVELNPAALHHFLKGRRVLVTGAGGSIGTELCRQIASCGVEALVLFERHENSLYHIANELADRGERIEVHPVIADVADAARVADVLKEYRPEIIFHAAAHKHVPLMEGNVCEAVKNNVTGTRVLMEAAERHGVDRFILISTDKAVNPTSVMGATKRVAELMLLTQGVGSGTSFMTVRFGNVLASSGSVIPRFLQQIKAGGPVTVTHAEMRRYFMLIPEAVQLVLHAAAHGEGGKLYALEMGEQVKLVDMARDLIRLAGFIPEVDIPITFIGLRPGEKLYEELVGPDETTELSRTDKIMGVKQRVMPDPEALAHGRTRLEDAARRNDTRSVIEYLGHLVPTFETGRLESATPLVGPIVIPVFRESSDVKSNAFGFYEHLCPECSSPQVRRSHPRSRLEEWRKSLSQKRAYRCHACGWRGWLLPQDPNGARSVAVEDILSPDFGAIDESVGANLGESRTVFSPRDLPKV